MAHLTDEERDRFLAKPRYGILNFLRADGSPIAVPVWFDWTGEAVRIFSSVISPKLKRLQADPRASLLVVNDISEPEAWVAFDGAASAAVWTGTPVADPRSEDDRQRISRWSPG